MSSVAGAAATVPHQLLDLVNRELPHVDRAACELDRWLRVLGRQEALCRRAIGCLAAAFLRQQAQHRLGFSRVGDYSRERLGISARELQTAARVVTALTTLPQLAAAFDAGAISWTQLQILVTVATSASEAHWLELASGRTVRALEALVRKARVSTTASESSIDAAAVATAGGPDAGRAGTACTETGSSGERSTGNGDVDERDGGSSAAVWAADDLDGALMHGEARLRFHLRCPRQVRRRWRHVVELARRMLGGDGPVWQAAEAIAAEGLAGAPRSGDGWGPGASDVIARDDKIGDHAPQGMEDMIDGGGPPVVESIGWSAVRAAIPEEIERLAHDCDRLDAFALDARLRQVLQAQRRIDWQLGRLLHTVQRLRLERALGFRCFAAYARERLGLSSSKARGLVAIERKTCEAAGFRTAYEAGELSWVRALALLPVVSERSAAAWTARAQAVTVRRLVAEVDWSLDQQDANPAGTVPPGPPPLGHDLAADLAECFDVERQMRAPGNGSLADAEIAFAGPASVVVLLQAAVAAFRQPGEPRWVGFERLLAHVAGEWEAQPTHRDPILDRDGWRCAVPACGARSNLHDHHIQFRSQGGDNAHGNRVTVCACHHLRGIHGGLVRASGTAPVNVRWELGLRAGQPPLMSFLGDTYVRGDGNEHAAQGEEGSVAAA